jgi:heme exporter protein CcmD
MSHWPFILISYALTVVAVVGLAIWSYVAMRGAERAADALRRDR